jgi:hypothetical protein
MKVRREYLRQLQFKTGSGVHQKPRKAQRRNAKVQLAKEI